MTGKQLPQLQSNEAEIALIGAALLDYKVFLLDISPTDFFWQPLGKLWAMGRMLAEKGIPADPITLPIDVLEEAGGAYGLQRFIDGCPNVTRAAHYAQIIKSLARQRKIVRVAERIAVAAHKDTAERVAEFQAALDEGRQLLSGDGSSIGWETYTLEDAYKPRPPLQYLVPGMFSIPSLSIIYGAPGTLKSMLMGDLAICVAGGIPWLSPLPGDEGNVSERAVIQAPAAWFDFDNGKRRMHERMEAMGRARNLGIDTPIHYVSMPSPWLDATDSGIVNGFIGYCKRRKVKLAVIDNLGSISVNADENSGEMIQIMASLRRAAEEAEMALVIIHHQRKSTGFNGRAGENLRGHSSIEAALDLALCVERQENIPAVRVQSTKTRDVDVVPFGALFCFEHKAGSTELQAAAFRGIEIDDKVSNTAVRHVAVEVVESKPGIKKESLIMEIKGILPLVGINRIRGMIDAMVEQGQLKERAGEQYNSKHFYTP